VEGPCTHASLRHAHNAQPHACRLLYDVSRMDADGRAFSHPGPGPGRGRGPWHPGSSTRV